MEVENEAFQIRPMNCPFHCLVYKDGLRSYRDLPFRWAELGTVYRCVFVCGCVGVWPVGVGVCVCVCNQPTNHPPNQTG